MFKKKEESGLDGKNTSRVKYGNKHFQYVQKHGHPQAVCLKVLQDI